MRQRVRTLFAGGVLTLAVLGVAAAGPIEDAKMADGRKDYTAELRILRPLAEQGNGWAEHDLAGMYVTGDGVPHDPEQADFLYRRAFEHLRPLAEKGNAPAQDYVGWMYANGQGLPEDSVEGALWTRKSAEQGYAPAQGNLGAMYDAGLGVPKSTALSIVWERKAALQGDTVAQYNLGVTYSDGNEMPPDHVQAYAWFSLAASGVYLPYREAGMGMRDLEGTKMTSSQIAQAKRMATEWAPK